MNVHLSDRLGYALSLCEGHLVLDPTKRHDFFFIFDATRCNPNGDPDSDNMPRQDFETGQGLVSSGSLKRKLRDFMADLYGTSDVNDDKGRMNLYVKHRGLLKNEHQSVRKKHGRGTTEENQKNMRDFFWDIRMFGGVLTVGKDDPASADLESSSDAGVEGETPSPKKLKQTGQVKKEDILNGGQCVGCVSIGMAETVEEIVPGLMSIVRTARTDNPKESIEQDKAVSSMPGSTAGMPYGLYRGTGQYFPTLDRFGQVTKDDLAVLWNGLRQMFQFSVSDARPAGSMKALAAWVFSHDHKLGNYPVHKLFELCVIRPSDGRLRTMKEDENTPPARHYRDYAVELAWEKNGIWTAPDGRLTRDGTAIGVTVTELYNDWRD
ncbi:MAG: type I CRISPR-associated protein Cas7 [Armatimonadetes bacterium]|nr:type I CRISPR-associated protein Cas7 [Armatimonadota bacterium]